MKTSSTLASGLCVLLSLFLLRPGLHAQNDNSQPIFGNPLSIHAESYDWVEASDDGTYRTDTYSTSSYTITVTSVLNDSSLATVGGDSNQGGVDGHINGGNYSDNYVETYGDGTLETWTYTVNLDPNGSSVHWLHTYVYDDGIGTISSTWDDSDGNSGWREISHADSISASNGIDTIALFGLSFDWVSGTTDSESDSEGTSNNYSRDRYECQGGGWVELDYAYISNIGGTFEDTDITGWDPDVGSFSAHLGGAFSGIGSVTWDPRTNPSFAPVAMWINGMMVSWQSGALSSNGTVTDTYADGQDVLAVTISGNVRDFRAGTSTAAITINGGTPGTVAFNSSDANNPTISVQDWLVSTTQPGNTHATPFILNNALSLWVNGSQCPFSAGYDDAHGNRIDVYENGGIRVILAGTAAGNAQVGGHSGTVFFTGMLVNSVFSVPNWSILTTAPVPPPGSFGPDALWVRGRFYQRTEVGSNDFEAGDGSIYGALVLSSDGQGTITVIGADSDGDFNGTFEEGTTRIAFISGEVQGEGSFPVPLIPADVALVNGIAMRQLLLPADAPSSAELPLSVMVTAPDGASAIFRYVGEVGAEGYNPDAAYYARHEQAELGTSLLFIDMAEHEVFSIDSVTGMEASGRFDPATHLFETYAPNNGFPAPVFSIDPQNSDAIWLMERPVDSGLPPSFIVRGQPWWFAGTDGDDALYRGFYEGQEMRVGPADADGLRSVTLQDRPHNGNDELTKGTLSNLRGSARLRDNTVVLSGTAQGTEQLITFDDGYQLHTIAADLDIVGNNLSFGILSGNASLAGALFQFQDYSLTASLHSALGRPQAQWHWWRAGATQADASVEVMRLEATTTGHELQLFSPVPPVAGTAAQPALILEAAAPGVTNVKGVLRVRPGGDISMGDFTSTPEGLAEP